MSKQRKKKQAHKEQLDKGDKKVERERERGVRGGGGQDEATNLEPLVYNVLHQQQFILPILHLHLEGFDEWRASHGLCLDDVVI